MDRNDKPAFVVELSLRAVVVVVGGALCALAHDNVYLMASGLGLVLVALGWRANAFRSRASGNDASPPPLPRGDPGRSPPRGRSRVAKNRGEAGPRHVRTRRRARTLSLGAHTGQGARNKKGKAS